MKLTSLVLLVAALISLSAASPAQAREKAKKASQPAAESLNTDLPTGSPSSSPQPKAVGLAAVDALTGAPTSLTGAIELDSKNTLQGFLSVPSTSPFSFSVAALFKHTIAEQQGAGLHIGGGVGLGVLGASAAAQAAAEAIGANGSSTSFSFSAVGLTGLHLPFPGVSNVQIHLDGGAILHIQSGANDFGIGALSGLLGVSVLYYL